VHARFYYAPNQFLGDNEERQSGQKQLTAENLTIYIWASRLIHDVTPDLFFLLLGRYGIRRYNEAFSERDMNFWTIGLHADWRAALDLKLALSYHFELYASKMGLTRIAKTLNALGIASPRGSAGWAPSAIREMLYRPLYRGEIVWNEYQKIERGGTKRRRRRGSEELIKVQAPELRLVPDELWQRVHHRVKHHQTVYIRSCADGMKGRLLGRPGMRDIDSPYLLSGFARCAHCGGPTEASGRDNARLRRVYGCVYHRKRGKTICKNDLRIDQDRLDQVLLQAISDVLDKKIAEAAVEEALRRLRSGEEVRMNRRFAIERELSLIEAHERNLVDAIARGENMDPLFAKLKAEENRKKELIVELDRSSRPADIVKLDEVRLMRDLCILVSDTKSLLRRQRTQARQILRKLLEQPLICEAFEENGKKGYKVTGRGSYCRLLPSQLAAPCVVSPTRLLKVVAQSLTFRIEGSARYMVAAR
jgi:hypothetical protein